TAALGAQRPGVWVMFVSAQVSSMETSRGRGNPTLPLFPLLHCRHRRATSVPSCSFSREAFWKLRLARSTKCHVVDADTALVQLSEQLALGYVWLLSQSGSYPRRFVGERNAAFCYPSARLTGC